MIKTFLVLLALSFNHIGGASETVGLPTVLSIRARYEKALPASLEALERGFLHECTYFSTASDEKGLPLHPVEYTLGFNDHLFKQNPQSQKSGVGVWFNVSSLETAILPDEVIQVSRREMAIRSSASNEVYARIRATSDLKLILEITSKQTGLKSAISAPDELAIAYILCD